MARYEVQHAIRAEFLRPFDSIIPPLVASQQSQLLLHRASESCHEPQDSATAGPARSWPRLESRVTVVAD